MIRNHIKFDQTEASRIQPKTQQGKWGENLSAGESGVFIIEYFHPGMEDNPENLTYCPGYLRGDHFFIGIYYWGAGATFQPGVGNLTNLLVEPHPSMTMMYSSNPWIMGGDYPKVPGISSIDVDTYEQAMGRFTLENMHFWIGFMATPWYAVLDGMAKAKDCPHHYPRTAQGKPITSGTNNGKYEYKFTNKMAGRTMYVSL